MGKAVKYYRTDGKLKPGVMALCPCVSDTKMEALQYSGAQGAESTGANRGMQLPVNENTFQLCVIGRLRSNCQKTRCHVKFKGAQKCSLSL